MSKNIKDTHLCIIILPGVICLCVSIALFILGAEKPCKGYHIDDIYYNYKCN